MFPFLLFFLFFFFLSFFLFVFFFFNDTATTEIYTLSLHDALPILPRAPCAGWPSCCRTSPTTDRKSTRLNSSHVEISYAVFCLKKKKKTNKTDFLKRKKKNKRNKKNEEKSK